MTDSRSWLSRANDHAAIEMQKLDAGNLTWEAVFEALRGAYLQGAVDQYNALESEWSEKHPHPLKPAGSERR